jgi:hypothetical protein
MNTIPVRCLAFAVLAFVPGTVRAQASTPLFPEDHRQLTRTISFADMAAFLKSVDGNGPIHVSVEGTSAGGHALYLVHASRGTPAWRVLFYAQQHGDEVSSKDALLYLIRDIARDPALLPADVDLWIMPMVNPDGAEADTRRNAVGADLNRDHIVLEQPETQALHRVVRRVRPDVAVDCHEFTRDSADRRAHGWIAWPDITMDGLDNPLFDRGVIAAGERWVEEAAGWEAEAGHPYARYTVGGLPPDEEQRHSAPETDSAVNAVGTYGGLSFIIEAAVMRSGKEAGADLGRRVDAYLVLFRRFIRGDGHRQEDLAAIAAGRRRPLPAFLPTNYLWVNPEMTVTEFPFVEVATGNVIKIPTANMMTEVAVKKTVPAPLGYAVEPRFAADFRTLLDRQGIPHETLAAARTVNAERCTLVRIEDQFDDLYSRYEGRQIVQCGAPGDVALPAGSVWVPLAGEAAIRAALVLEPESLYGLYQYPRYRAMVGADAVVPVLRVVR